MSGGARWSHEEKDSFQTFQPANRATAFAKNLTVTDHYSQNNLSPQVTARWKPSDALTAYAAYKEGFKAGGYNITQSLTLTSTQASASANGRFVAETAAGFEGGLRTALAGRALHLNITAFSYRYSDLQVQFFNPVTAAQVVANVGSLTTRGIEADFAWRVGGVEGLGLHGAVAYNRARYHDFIGQCYGGQDFDHGCNQQPNAAGIYNGQVFSGRTPPKAPKLSAQLGAAYDFPVAGLTGTVTADANYSSRYNFTDTLRPDAWQPAFTRIDATFSVADEARGWRASLIGRNLTNRLVATSSVDMVATGGTGGGAPHGAAPGVPADMNVIVERGREVYVEFRQAF